MMGVRTMPGVRLIDANAVLKEIKETYCTDCNNYNGVICRACTWMDAMDYIEDAQTVDAQPVKHGHWIENSDPGQNINEHYMCSECGCTFRNWANDNYCPNCGAKMDGESDA